MSIEEISRSTIRKVLYLNLIAATALILLSGCMYRMKTLAEEASFTGEALHKGGLALFGTIGSNLLYPVDTLLSRAIDSAMGQRLSNKMTSTPICLPESTMILLTTRNYDYIRMNYEPAVEMDDKSKDMLRDRQSYLPDFMLMVFVEGNRIWDEIEKSGDRGTGYRYITVRANIYEVATGKLVWSIRISHGDSKSSERNSGLKIAGISLSGDNWSDGPAPPDALDVLGEIFDKLGEALLKRR